MRTPWFTDVFSPCPPLVEGLGVSWGPFHMCTNPIMGLRPHDLMTPDLTPPPWRLGFQHLNFGECTECTDWLKPAHTCGLPLMVPGCRRGTNPMRRHVELPAQASASEPLQLLSQGL